MAHFLKQLYYLDPSIFWSVLTSFSIPIGKNIPRAVGSHQVSWSGGCQVGRVLESVDLLSKPAYPATKYQCTSLRGNELVHKTLSAEKRGVGGAGQVPLVRLLASAAEAVSLTVSRGSFLTFWEWTRDPLLFILSHGSVHGICLHPLSQFHTEEARCGRPTQAVSPERWDPSLTNVLRLKLEVHKDWQRQWHSTAPLGHTIFSQRDTHVGTTLYFWVPNRDDPYSLSKIEKMNNLQPPESLSGCFYVASSRLNCQSVFKKWQIFSRGIYTLNKQKGIVQVNYQRGI